jgi:hypothetical protein
MEAALPRRRSATKSFQSDLSRRNIGNRRCGNAAHRSAEAGARSPVTGERGIPH